MSATGVALEHIYKLLKPEVSTAVGGRISFGAVATANPTYPLVLIQPYGAGRDKQFNGQDNPIAQTTVTMQVRVVAEDTGRLNLGTVFNLYDLIHSKLNGTTGVYDDGTVIDCSRYETADLHENENGRTYIYHGGRYLITIVE